MQLDHQPFRRVLRNPINLFLVMFAFLVMGCVPQVDNQPGDAWHYADLRVLEPYDPNQLEGDFIAGYSRFAGSDFQVRLDLLELAGLTQVDYYVALDFKPGGSQILPLNGEASINWDVLLYLPDEGDPLAFNPPPRIFSTVDTETGLPLKARTDLIPRIIRLPWQDYIQISINKYFLPALSQGIQIQVFSTAPDAVEIRDSIGPFRSDDLPPQRAPLLLAFWNSLPAYSPAQSLRLWDGAHTGPYGERHGLSILLGNVRKYSVPVTLLDLRSPTGLSSLDFLNKIPLIQELYGDKLLTLPDSLPGSPTFPLFPDGLPDWASSDYLEYSNQISEQFNIPVSRFLYAPRKTEITGDDYALYFLPADQNPQVGQLIALPPQIPREPQANPDGFPLAIRKILIDNALLRTSTPSSFPLLVLGGDLQESTFADPASSNATLSYIANHPWIQPINRDDLGSLPATVKFQYMPGDTLPSNVELFSPSSMLANFPGPNLFHGNPLYEAAIENVFSLYAPLPPEPQALAELRSSYSNQPGILLAAAQWAEKPYASQECQVDLDLDGLPECILSSGEIFAVIDPLGGRLVGYFYRNGASAHQIIAPSSQFIVGLADPSTWQLAYGEGADPAGIPGAFSDSAPPWQIYEVSNNSNQLSFRSLDQQITKVYTLAEDSLQINYHTSDPITGQIPVVIDPWQRFSPGWSDQYSYQTLDNGYRITLHDVLSVDITSDLPLEFTSFTDSQEHLDIPEDPNFDYPQGHYLPFPVTAITYTGQTDFGFQIRITLSDHLSQLPDNN
ncbi:MAG: hypothetical protein ACWGOY_01705 [Anaerolineales bacterium]